MEKAIVTRELTFSDLVSEGLHRYVGNIKGIVLIFLCTVLPANLLSTLIGVAFSLIGRLSASAMEESDTISLMLCSGLGTASLFSGILISVVQLWAIMAVARLVEDDVLDRNPDWKAALRQTWHRLLGAIGTSLLMGFYLLVLSFLLVIPGIIYSIYWIFTPYVVTLRGVGGQQALDYSKSLVNDRWWLVFGTCFIFFLVLLPLFLPIMCLSAALSQIPFAGFVANTVIQIAAALSTVLLVVFFLNLDYCRSGAPSPDKPKSLAELMGTGSPTSPSANAPEMPRFKLPDPPA
jgi:hypothetical protein